ncbi:50S ribosomal protein L30 [bacterium]|nr:50S ribosomal protein L30 [bacterium]
MSDQVKVTLERSINGTTQRQRQTVSALGLTKRGSSHVLPDRAEIRGMIRKVQHLVKVEEVKA